MKDTHTPIEARPTTDPDLDAELTPAALLHGAAVYLHRHGWTQGEVFDLVGGPDPDTAIIDDENIGPLWPKACAVGAINMAGYGRCMLTADTEPTDDEARPVIRALRVFAATIDPDYDPCETSAVDVIGDWNDAEDRTRDDVIQALHDAADDWDRIHTTGGAR